jgi:hypothetical protein
MMNSLPDEEKAAYLDAAEKCPELIEAETNPQFYVDFCNGNKEKAAALLAKQWILRVMVFQERAFLPLNDLSGKGALTEEDVKALKSGFFAWLPDDAQGRTVIFGDNSRNTHTESSHGRSFFYVAHVAAMQKKPAVALRWTDTNKIEKENGGKTGIVGAFLSHFALQLISYVALYLPPPGACRMFRETMVPLYRQYLGPDLSQKHIVSESTADMLQELINLGFEMASLPECVGGTWSYDNFTKWVESQEAVTETQSPQLDLKDRKRKVDADYSRQRRQRLKGQEQVVRKEFNQLQDVSFSLRRENHRLQVLLNKCKAILSVVAIPQATVVGPTQAPLLSAPSPLITALSLIQQSNSKIAHKPGPVPQTEAPLISFLRLQNKYPAAVQSTISPAVTSPQLFALLLQQEQQRNAAEIAIERAHLQECRLRRLLLNNNSSNQHHQQHHPQQTPNPTLPGALAGTK